MEGSSYSIVGRQFVIMSVVSAPTNPPMTQSAYNDITNGTYNEACFVEYAHNSPSVVPNEVVVCGTDGIGGTAHHCAGMTRVDTVGVKCRAMCAKSPNKARCQSSAASYCQQYMGNPECACLQPSVGEEGVTWGTGDNQMTYSEFETFVANNQELTAANKMCFWPPCAQTNKDEVFPRPSLEAPNICPNPSSIKCLVKNISVSVSNVRANNVSVVNQNCGGSGIQGSSPANASKGFMTEVDDMSLTQKILAGIGVLLALAMLIVPIILVYIRHKRTTATTQAQLRQTQEIHHIAKLYDEVKKAQQGSNSNSNSSQSSSSSKSS